MKDSINLNKENKLESLVNVSLEKIRSLIDVNCVVGSAISMPDGSSIIPISKVSVGFVSGGGEYSDLNSKRNSADFQWLVVQEVGLQLVQLVSLLLIKINSN